MKVKTWDVIKNSPDGRIYNTTINSQLNIEIHWKQIANVPYKT